LKIGDFEAQTKLGFLIDNSAEENKRDFVEKMINNGKFSRY
jgi:hypothetical protein